MKETLTILPKVQIQKIALKSIHHHSACRLEYFAKGTAQIRFAIAHFCPSGISSLASEFHQRECAAAGRNLADGIAGRLTLKGNQEGICPVDKKGCADFQAKEFQSCDS